MFAGHAHDDTFAQNHDERDENTERFGTPYIHGTCEDSEDTYLTPKRLRTSQCIHRTNDDLEEVGIGPDYVVSEAGSHPMCRPPSIKKKIDRASLSEADTEALQAITAELFIPLVSHFDRETPSPAWYANGAMHIDKLQGTSLMKNAKRPKKKRPRTNSPSSISSQWAQANSLRMTTG